MGTDFLTSTGAAGIRALPRRLRAATFTPGHPRPQGSKRHVGNGRMIESSRYVAGWREAIATAAAAVLPSPLDRGPVAVQLDFVMPRPQRTPLPTPPATKRTGDIDKLTRAVLDALTGVWIADDADVIQLDATKVTAEPDQESGVAIRLYAIDWTPEPEPVAISGECDDEDCARFWANGDPRNGYCSDCSDDDGPTYREWHGHDEPSVTEGPTWCEATAWGLTPPNAP